MSHRPHRFDGSSRRTALTIALLCVVAVPATLVLRQALAADCVTDEHRTVCGYHCIKSDGQLRCAQSPEGVCSATSSVVVCWDPPALLRKIFDKRVPSPSCVTNDGRTACGYHCVSNYGSAQCAQTPFGACRANEGKLVCWDPPARVMLRDKKQTPEASCIAAYGKVACGYHCEANQGVLRCATTPEGLCRRERDTVVCWDPPPEADAVAYEPATERACLEAEQGRLCGFRCLATRQRAQCGRGRNDSCQVRPDGTIACSSPY